MTLDRSAALFAGVVDAIADRLDHAATECGCFAGECPKIVIDDRA
jgi:hypothetical protein